MVMSVVAAVERDLAGFGELAVSGLAASALVMAAQLDDPGTSATSKAMCAARLESALDRLRELAPPAVAASPLDEIRARRDARVAAA